MSIKTKSISIRLSEDEYKLLKKTGYKPYKIVKMFLKKYYNTTPIGLAVELDSLKLELDELPDRELTIKNKISKIENKLSNYNDLDLISDSTSIAIKDTIKHYLNKQISYRDITDFLDNNNELVIAKANKTGYAVEEYKKLVIDYNNKFYD
jgi:hypothetical protein